MALRIHQTKNFKSLEDLFLDIERLTLIAGENGAGKTQLIEAIASGHFSSEDGEILRATKVDHNFSLIYGPPVSFTKIYEKLRAVADNLASHAGFLGQIRDDVFGENRKTSKTPPPTFLCPFTKPLCSTSRQN